MPAKDAVGPTEIFSSAVLDAGIGDEKTRAQISTTQRRRPARTADIKQIVSDRHLGIGQILAKAHG